MRLTNHYNLPEAMLNVMGQFRKPQEKRISVTELVGAPLIRHLRMKHWEELEEDASELLWALLGQSVHYALEKGTPLDAIQEERLEAKFGDIVISGQSDLWHRNIIEDYKVTSTYAFLLGDKPDWERQLNVYGYLWARNGFDVTGLKIRAILRDWVKSKSLQDESYPKIPFVTVNIPLWPIEKTEAYIQERIRLHLAEPTECTPEEKWTRPTTYAVMKNGAKRASRVLDTQEESEKWMGDQKGFSIVERPGKDIRCEDYCQVRAFCPYRRKQ